MNETRRKPTTGTQCTTIFYKRHGIFYMSSCIDTAGHTKAFDYPVTQTRLDIPRPLITESHRHAGHTKAFDYPVTQTRLDIPRPLITQSHRHGWTYQGLWLPSHTDTAGHTKAFDYPVTQTRLDIPRPLITQSHRHGWTYQGIWLPSHTDTSGHTKAFDYPDTQTRLDIPSLWLPRHTDTAGHTKAFDYPVTQTRLDIPRSLITQSHRHGWTYPQRPLITQSWTTAGLPAMWNRSHMRDEALPRAGFEPTAVKDLLITSGTPYRLGPRGPSRQ